MGHAQKLDPPGGEGEFSLQGVNSHTALGPTPKGGTTPLPPTGGGGVSQSFGCDPKWVFHTTKNVFTYRYPKEFICMRIMIFVSMGRRLLK